MSHIVDSGNSKVYIQADVTNLPLFVRNPDWHLMLDQDATAGRSYRRKVYDMLVAEKMMVQGFHYPFPALAHIEKAERAIVRSYCGCPCCSRNCSQRAKKAQRNRKAVPSGRPFSMRARQSDIRIGRRGRSCPLRVSRLRLHAQGHWP